MKNVIQSNALIIGFSVALILLGGLSVYTWNLHGEVTQLRTEISQSDAGQTNSNPIGSSIFDPVITKPGLFSNDPLSQGPISSQGLFGQDPFAQLRQTMDNFMYGDGLASSTLGRFDQGSPKIHIDETGPDYLIRIEVPEHQELELNTEVDGDLFRVSGVFKHQEDLANDRSKFYRSSESRFSRSFVLREEVDESKMVIENTGKGVIIRLPKVA